MWVLEYNYQLLLIHAWNHYSKTIFSNDKDDYFKIMLCIVSIIDFVLWLCNFIVILILLFNLKNCEIHFSPLCALKVVHIKSSFIENSMSLFFLIIFCVHKFFANLFDHFYLTFKIFSCYVIRSRLGLP